MPRAEHYGNPAGLTQDIEVVRAIYAAFNARDVEAALPHLAPDCELHLRGTAAVIGREEPYRGHDGMREYFADVEGAWEELTIHADDYRAIPGSVIVMGHVTARRNGEPVRRNAVWTWKVSEGKATHVRVADTGPTSEAA
jgi:ketosteroid isomerase-like protein